MQFINMTMIEWHVTTIKNETRKNLSWAIKNATIALANFTKIKVIYFDDEMYFNTTFPFSKCN